ncbi:MAG: hypothetical protein GAK33_07209 [Burkholderia lata]|uniref:Phosphate ABC transporter permease n=1 Tax=Burkholderia lata (strain ATCC 17760 / DSM 23089 / LMG 22485 / NCIMB 9086 / R18194 / 383) TaxID=482957 RepID=A0A833PK39_BURL3|nr:hypothetical protein [Burkholderia lata]KAF1031976.1 MAG: hypothetical protein GAK33_07209 [Burkholderia lata]
MKRLLILMLSIAAFGPAHADDTHADPWSGTYVLLPWDKDSQRFVDRAVDTLTIEKANDADAARLPSKYGSDLSRWSMSSRADETHQKRSLRRFLADSETDEYQEFRWSTLHAQRKIECIDGGHFFICQTAPNSLVDVWDMKFRTTSGIFGVLLHGGLFELQRVGMP